eukprot:12264409-Heterocapsa_arctica.AAC.1
MRETCGECCGGGPSRASASFGPSRASASRAPAGSGSAPSWVSRLHDECPSHCDRRSCHDACAALGGC